MNIKEKLLRTVAVFWPGIVLIFAGLQAAGQSGCNCPEFFKLKSGSRNSNTANGGSYLAALKKISTNACAAKAMEWEAELLMKANDMDSAQVVLQQVTTQYQSDNCGEIAYINNHRLQAEIYHNRGDYQQALELCFRLLNITRGSPLYYEHAGCLLLIAVTFDRMKASEKGIVYTRQAIPLINNINPSFEKADLLQKIASRYLWRYQDISDEPGAARLLDTAEAFTREQLRVCRQIGNNTLLTKGYNHLNGFAHERGNYALALKYIDSALLYAAPGTNDGLRATNFGDKADVLMELKQYSESRRFADSCLYYHEQNKNPETIANAYALIYQISTRSENYKAALAASERYMEIKDSLTNIKKLKTISELEKKYNQAANEKTIQKLALQRRIYLLLAIAGLLLLIALGFFIKQVSLKSRHKILETEQRLNRARMNPHFFFNALSSLQSFALRENDGKLLAGNLSKFSHIMRETLESTYREYVTVEQETTFLNEYLGLQQIRFPQKFTWDIQIDAAVEPEELMIPSMIMQPFVENSIEHGFKGIEHPGKINISFTRSGNDLLISISDNGKGLMAAGLENDAHISRASQIIRDRIFLLNVKLKTRAGFAVANNAGGGVLVTITLPVLTKQRQLPQ